MYHGRRRASTGGGFLPLATCIADGEIDKIEKAFLRGFYWEGRE
jgi:hypothetical protein